MNGWIKFLHAESQLSLQVTAGNLPTVRSYTFARQECGVSGTQERLNREVDIKCNDNGTTCGEHTIDSVHSFLNELRKVIWTHRVPRAQAV
jgi:hypothetical protein